MVGFPDDNVPSWDESNDCGEFFAKQRLPADEDLQRKAVRLADMERQIEACQQGTEDALTAIEEEQLYLALAEYTNFDDYLRDRWPDISKATYYRRKWHRQVLAKLTQLGFTRLPSQNLAQIIHTVDDGLYGQLWQNELNAADAEQRQPNAASLQQLRKELLGESDEEPEDTPPDTNQNYSIELVVPDDLIDSAMMMLGLKGKGLVPAPTTDRLRKTKVPCELVGEWVGKIGAWLTQNKVQVFSLRVS